MELKLRLRVFLYEKNGDLPDMTLCLATLALRSSVGSAAVLSKRRLPSEGGIVGLSYEPYAALSGRTERG